MLIVSSRWFPCFYVPFWYGDVGCAVGSPSSLGTSIGLPTSGDVYGHTLVLGTLDCDPCRVQGLSSYSSARIVIGTLGSGSHSFSVGTTKATVQFLATFLSGIINR